MNNIFETAVVYSRSGDRLSGAERQSEQIEAFAVKYGFKITKHFHDINPDTPSLRLAAEFAMEAGVNVFVLWRLDRAGESGRSIDSAFALVNQFTKSGIRFISIQDDLDSEKSAADFLPKLESAVEMAASVIKGERVRASLTNTKKLGESIGRPTSRNNKMIYELRSQGKTQKQIAEETGDSIWAVKRALKAAPRDLD